MAVPAVSLAVLVVASAGCGALASTSRGSGKAIIGGILAIFGSLAAGAAIVAILAMLRARRRSLLGLAIASWALLIMHLAGIVIAVESGPMTSGLLPWYLRIAVATSVAPVAGAACTTSLALSQLSNQSRRWVTPVVVIGVLLVHTALLVGFLVDRDPFRALSEAPVVEVRVGAEHGCARHEDGTVTCWGRNAEGQLGDGTRQDADWPVAVQGLFDATGLAVGDGRACARTSGGIIMCWGRDPQSGEGVAAPVPIARAILAGPWIAGNRVYAVDGSGMVVSGYDSLEPLVPLPPVTRIAAGLRHVCVLLGDGHVSCWGDGRRGQLGESVTFDRQVPTEEDDEDRLDLHERVLLPGLTDAVELVAGDHHTCALRATGTVACWGVRNEGDTRCRDGCTASGVTDVEPLRRVVALTAGANHTCALRDNGTVACWGDNRWGQLGIGGYRSIDEPQSPELEGPAAAIFANGYTTCAVMESGEVRCWGASRSGSLGVESLEACRARKILASSYCATRPQPLRWIETD